LENARKVLPRETTTGGILRIVVAQGEKIWGKVPIPFGEKDKEKRKEQPLPWGERKKVGDQREEQARRRKAVAWLLDIRRDILRPSVLLGRRKRRKEGRAPDQPF